MSDRPMKIHTCYTAEIRKALLRDGSAVPVDGSLMSRTAEICLEALTFCVRVYLENWNVLSGLGQSEQRTAAERLIHSTGKNTAAYPEFDQKFPDMPSGIRRAIRCDALGIVSSYVSNHRNWEQLSPAVRGDEPVLGIPKRYELTFYSTERDTSLAGNGIVSLKLFDGRTWGWHAFCMKPSDIRYVCRISKTRRMLSPSIEKVHGRYRLRFCFEESKKLVSAADPLGYRILAVDLGINAAGTWCVMEADGTVQARGVIHARAEEGRLLYSIGRIRQYQQAGKRSGCVYRWLKSANRDLSIATARQIMQAAELYDVDCIVFEHLDTSGKKRGRMKARLHHWRAADVRKRVEIKAHRDGMRISRICAWKTSALAFDGSGPVTRGVHGNYSVCRFRNGKTYNCDLSASYNIGARFFLREYTKLYPYAGIPKAPWRTYSDLINLHIQTALSAAA